MINKEISLFDNLYDHANDKDALQHVSVLRDQAGDILLINFRRECKMVISLNCLFPLKCE